MKSLKLKIKSWQKGFTLIELLIVIALIGILAVALLSAINPLEQLRKGRDSARKADAAELMNAVERFYASYQCYPWDLAACDNTVVLAGATDTPTMDLTAAGEIMTQLLAKNELKTQFSDRVNTVGNVSYQKLWVVEDGWVSGVAGSVSVCFEPESKTGRSGGLGRMRDQVSFTTSAVVADCSTTNYLGGGAGALCWICVPQ